MITEDISFSVSTLLGLLDSIAPFETAEPWDNVGLLSGSSAEPVRGILCALDLTSAVLSKAAEFKCNIVVTHHPILFRGRKNLCRDDAEGKLLCDLVKADVSLIAMHTNLDAAHPGVNDALALRLELEKVLGTESGMCLGTTDPISVADLAERVSSRLDTAVRIYGDQRAVIQKIAVMGGAADDYLGEARSLGAEAFVTGEAGYHKALEASWNGLTVIEAGHAATESPVVPFLADAIRKRLTDLGANIPVYEVG